MYRLLVAKELKAIFLSPKFVATFGVCALLLVLSTYTGIREYEAAVSQYQTATRLAEQEMQEQGSWMSVRNRVHRTPDPLQIFAGGVHYDVGRLSSISSWVPVKLRMSPYSDEPLFAVFRVLDFVFIVQIVLTLFAILFTYDAVNGEKEQGTLRLTFANPVPKATYLLGKFSGAWLGLTVPLLIPLLLSVLLVLVFRVPMTGGDWTRLGVLLGASVLLFTFFIAFGLLMSTLTRRSTVSFLALLVAWVALVLVVPRAALLVAGQVVEVPGVSEIESQRERFEQEAMDTHVEAMGGRWRERSALMESMSEEEREAYRDEHEWEWMQEDDAARRRMQEEVGEYGRQLEEGLRNRQREQQRLAFALARVSPAAVYQLAAMNLAGTDLALKTRYEDALRTYREQFLAYARQKQDESGGRGGMQISVGDGGAFSIRLADRERLDLSEAPRFEPPRVRPSDALPAVVPDLGLLAVFTLLAFAGAFVGFLRFDVR